MRGLNKKKCSMLSTGFHTYDTVFWSWHRKGFELPVYSIWSLERLLSSSALLPKPRQPNIRSIWNWKPVCLLLFFFNLKIDITYFVVRGFSHELFNSLRNHFNLSIPRVCGLCLMNVSPVLSACVMIYVLILQIVMCEWLSVVCLFDCFKIYCWLLRLFVSKLLIR